MHHTLSWWDEENKGKKSVKLGTRAVHMQPLNDEMFHVPPKVSTTDCLVYEIYDNDIENLFDFVLKTHDRNGCIRMDKSFWWLI